MKNHLIYVTPIAAAYLLVVLSLHGCSKGTQTAPAADPATASAQVVKTLPAAPITLTSLTADQLMLSFDQAAGSAIPLVLNYDRYAALKPTFIPQFNSFFAYFLQQNSLTGLVGSFDCISYCNLYQALAEASTVQTGSTNSALPIGILVVDQLKPWANIPGEYLHENPYYHAVIVILTSEGWYVVEPQNGTTCKLADYPNRLNINQARF